MKAISENTPITIGLVISLIGAVVAITTVSNKTEANSADIVELKKKQDDFMKIREDIATIRVKVENIEQKVN